MSPKDRRKSIMGNAQTLKQKHPVKAHSDIACRVGGSKKSGDHRVPKKTKKILDQTSTKYLVREKN